MIAEDTGHASQIRSLGFDYVHIPFGREFIGLGLAVSSALRLLVMLLRLRPDIVFLVATASYTLGWPAALFLFRTKFIRVVSGAGRALQKNTSRTNATKLVRACLALSTRLKNFHSLFQLESDLERFVGEKLACRSRSTVIPGTGIDTRVWAPIGDRERGVPVVLFAGRLFREKGIYEFVELARMTPKSKAKFLVVGRPDGGVATSVQPEELEGWLSEELFEYLGETDDMISVYQRADIIVLPSSHPEGTPKVLIEAAACGVAGIASEQPGCRAVVVHGKTGLIANLDEEKAFSEALHTLLDNPEMRSRLGAGARALADQKFSLEKTLANLYDLVEIHA